MQSCSAGSNKRVVLETEELKSTWEHRLITGGTLTLLALLLGKGVSEANSLAHTFAGVGAAVFAYYLSGNLPYFHYTYLKLQSHHTIVTAKACSWFSGPDTECDANSVKSDESVQGSPVVQSPVFVSRRFSDWYIPLGGRQLRGW